jgi:NADPH:quinone reductase-like Zn-dependent oxidoreductase
MKAIVCTKYGPPEVLQLQQIETPTPRDNQVLVRVCAVSANPLDLGGMSGALIARAISGAWRGPKNPVLGCDIAGRVEAIGKDVTRFAVGDEAFGAIGAGGFAEYACGSEKGLVKKPAHISYESAAASPVTGLTALQALRDKGHIQAGQRVVINGAAGGVGTMAVQMAKAFGAQVTAVCGAPHVDLLRTIGADHVIDYSKQDFTRNGQQYDLILAINGYHPIWAYSRALAPGGTSVVVGGSLRQVAEAMLLGRRMSGADAKNLGFLGVAKINTDDLQLVSDWLASGKIDPVIEKRYTLEQTPEAMRYLKTGHVGGKLVIGVAP